MADSQQSYPSGTTGINVTVGVELSGSGVILATGEFEYNIRLAYGASATVSATPVDVEGNAQSATVTAQSYNGPPSQTGEAGKTTAVPPPNGGGTTYGAGAPLNAYANLQSTPDHVDGVYPSSDVASVSGTNPYTVTADNVGEALVEFTAQGRTGRLKVSVVQP